MFFFVTDLKIMIIIIHFIYVTPSMHKNAAQKGCTIRRKTKNTFLKGNATITSTKCYNTTIMSCNKVQYRARERKGNCRLKTKT